MATKQTLSERADALEEQQIRDLGDRIVGISLLYYLSDGERSLGPMPSFSPSCSACATVQPLAMARCSSVITPARPPLPQWT